MNDLHRALHDIRSIRRQLAQSTQFRGYGPVTLAATGVLALAAAAAQAVWLPQPADHLLVYAAIWISTAVLSAALIAVQTITRANRMHSGLADEMIRMAVEQFLPAVLAGALLTAVLWRAAAAQLWMLPGLWQVVYSLGIFSSCRFLPRPMLAAGAWYLASGLACLALGDVRALSPWTMGVAYAVGQGLTAGILFVAAPENLEGGTDEA
jgi:hypothetical protein